MILILLFLFCLKTLYISMQTPKALLRVCMRCQQLRQSISIWRPGNELVMFLLSAPTCGLWVLRKGRGGLWRWQQPSLSGATAMNACLCLPLSYIFISCPHYTPHPPSAPHKLTQTCSCPHRGPRCTNDLANYVFKVFGSCENSFGLAVEGGGGSWEEEGHGVVHGLMAIITAQRFM